MIIKGNLTPQFLAEVLTPYIRALSDFQNIIDELQNKPLSLVKILSLSDDLSDYIHIEEHHVEVISPRVMAMPPLDDIKFQELFSKVNRDKDDSGINKVEKNLADELSSTNELKKRGRND